MRVAVISCFAEKSNYNRGNFIYEYFKKGNSDCFMIYSEFQHGSKKNVIAHDEQWIPIKTLAYTKNVSIRRLFSHIIFGIKAAKTLKELKPAVVYMAVPPNSVTLFAIKVARKMKCKIIIDIVDLWPESFPVPPEIKKILSPVLNIWKRFRDDTLTHADALLFECGLYKDFLERKNIRNKNSHVIYLAKECRNNPNPEFVSCINNKLNICYLGSINLLIDIDLVVNVLTDVSKQRRLKMHIIGMGDKKSYFLSELLKNNIDFIDYGTIYDELEKNKIMSFCDFGINLYRDNTIIGLTYKSIDYLAAGLPLINSIKGDTWGFIENDVIGINCDRKTFQATITELVQMEAMEISEMKKKAFKFYLNNFESNVVEKKLDFVMQTLQS